MTTGQKVIWEVKPMDAKRIRPMTGTVIRVDPPADGWGEGITVDYPKVRYMGERCAIFHEMPSRWVREA